MQYFNLAFEWKIIKKKIQLIKRSNEKNPMNKTYSHFPILHVPVKIK